MFEPTEHVTFVHVTGLRQEQQECLLLPCQTLLQDSLLILVCPYPRDLALNETVHYCSCFISRERMKQSHQLCDEPFCGVEHHGRIHLIWIYISSRMANAAVVPDVIQADHHPRNKDACRSAVWNLLVGTLHLPTLVGESTRLRSPRRICAALQPAFADSVYSLTQLAAVEFRGFPAVLPIIVDNLVECIQQIVSQRGRQDRKSVLRGQSHLRRRSRHAACLERIRVPRASPYKS
ncbi:Uncharacterised protein [Mycobacteroides abscessus subsp. abscessus]|nr:Uncharacterised protein [Mycobacteroides abscessus subsp. abscessus]